MEVESIHGFQSDMEILAVRGRALASLHKYVK
jgi:hypothetical protein